jgi:hypothetical protein
MARRRMMFVSVIVVGALSVGAGLARAQIVIFDPAVTFRNAAIAALKAVVLDTLGNEVDRLKAMAKRLSASTNLDKYFIAADDTPKWRIHPFQFEKFLYVNGYNAALNYGDGSGAAYEDIARVRTTPGSELSALDDTAPDAEAALLAELATLDAADSTLIAGTNQTGLLRYNGRRELAAIQTLQDDALDPSSDQSATAVLDKISGASLIHAQQQQARMQFLAAIVEQLLVDNKRDRDTEAAVMNMQLERLRWGAAANRSLVAGSADDLRTWRQP